jgi:hypothetical protein
LARCGSGSGTGVNITGAVGTVTKHAAISGVAFGISPGKGGLVTNSSSIIGGMDSVIVQGAAGTMVNSGICNATVNDEAGISCWLTSTCASHWRNRSKSL